MPQFERITNKVNHLNKIPVSPKSFYNLYRDLWSITIYLSPFFRPIWPDYIYNKLITPRLVIKFFQLNS